MKIFLILPVLFFCGCSQTVIQDSEAVASDAIKVSKDIAIKNPISAVEDGKKMIKDSEKLASDIKAAKIANKSAQKNIVTAA